MGAWGSRLVSNNQRPLLINPFFGPDMLHPVLPVRAEKIKAQAVCSGINLVNQHLPENRPLRRINDAFKNGELHPLAEILAGLGHAPQPALARFIHSRHIVAYQNKHMLFPEKYRVSVKITPQMPGQEQGLGMEQQADRHFFFYKRMHDLILFAVLIGNQHCFSCLVIHENRT